MICPSCKKREATIHITQNVNGKTTRIDLCPVCAKEQGYLEEPEGISGLFGGELFGNGATNLFKMAGGMPGVASPAQQGERCAYCGTSFEEFRNRGLLGCCHCYDEFGQRLLPVIRRIQAGETHVGRRPDGAPPAPRPEDKAAEEKKRLLKRPVRIPKKPPEDKAAPGAADAVPLDAAKTAATKAPAVASAPAKSPAPPAAESEMERLRHEQAEAVKAEDYEKAARIRDRIRALEPDKEGGTTG
jgi:protein arginine kinase activator